MIWFRKWMILIHRYLGIALSLLFLMWFVSGIAMIYARAMPTLTPDARLRHMPALDLSRVRLTASEAATRGDLSGSPRRVVLLTIMGRPAYRFGGGTSTTVFADTGDVLEEIGEAESLAVASRFLNMPRSVLRHLGVLHTADQWTIGQRQLPLHKIGVDDDARTELYVSEELGEVVVETTRGSRALAWVAAIPHWLYFSPLRLNDALWRQVVLWASGLGTVTALIGLVLAVMQYKVQYAGLMRWHYVTGTVFGVFAVTWVFSGLLSMEPWNWAAAGNSPAGIAPALSGGPLDLSRFALIDVATWNQAMAGRSIKELELRRLQGEPYYVARGGGPRLLVSAESLRVRSDAFSVDSITERVKQGSPDVPILDSEVLSGYDAYYYDRDRDSPLPVLRLKLADADRTWLYIDLATSHVAARFTRRGRVERWVYHGLHSLDFSFWYGSRPLWDIGMIGLCAGGATLSGIGVVIGFRRLRRTTTKNRPKLRSLRVTDR